jgi:hypothetical protein
LPVPFQGMVHEGQNGLGASIEFQVVESRQQTAHQGVSEFVYFFAENTKITTKTTRLNKLYFSHARIDINYIEEILV